MEDPALGERGCHPGMGITLRLDPGKYLGEFLPSRGTVPPLMPEEKDGPADCDLSSPALRSSLGYRVRITS